MFKYSDIYCSTCDTSDFSRGRYECQICANYYICVLCYNNKRQTLNHSSSHRMLLIESPSTADSNALSGQHTDQMTHLQDKYLSKMLTDLSMNDSRSKMATPSIKTFDEFSVNELYEYLFRLDPSMIMVSEKLRDGRVSGADLVNFNDNNYEKFSVTYGEKKKLQLLIEQKQVKLNPQAVASKEIIEKQEQEIQEKNQVIRQLENVVEQQDQQARLQDAIIKQLQEALDKQSEEMRVLIELTQQYRSLSSTK